ncbi:unnamed protein product [Durusdinium trenchii]|uniref:MYND-type domain-containing protein n=1 Tax=Durusdinium trenchii TaxID=1381693 RepID=A0ABP0PB80_9DINO
MEINLTVKDKEKSKSDADLSVGELRHLQIRHSQISSLNNFFRQKHKRSKKRGIAPQILYVERPDNPWRDRYLVCKDCERRVNYENKPPRSNCNNSTVMELDMTAQFSRDNVMVTSCELVQMVRDDVWVKYEKGTYARTDKKQAPAFPVQVCCVCRKTTLEEGRRFKVCPVCEGAAYCSESCFAEHNLKHQASCVRPHLPYRGEWGIRKELREMRKEIYPLINSWVFREPEDSRMHWEYWEHRVAWLPPPEHQQKILDAQRTPKRISLAGGRSRKLLPAEGLARSSVEGGQIVLRKKDALAYRSPRAYRKQEEPDQTFLDDIGMTREEYMRKDLELRAEAIRADEEALSLVPVNEEEEEPEEDLSLPLQTFGGKKVRPRTTLHGTHIPVPVREVPKLVFSQEAVERVEAAAANGEVNIDDPQLAPTKPPWEIPREGQKKFWTPLPEEKKKEGVQYPESPVRELAKKYGVRLSEEALDRLEKAAETAEPNRNRISWQKPVLKDDAPEKLA